MIGLVLIRLFAKFELERILVNLIRQIWCPLFLNFFILLLKFICNISTKCFKKLKALDISLIIYTIGRYFLHWFKKNPENTHYLTQSSFLSRNDIIDLFSSNVTHVCEIVTCFINYDAIDLYIWCRIIYFDTTIFVSG